MTAAPPPAAHSQHAQAAIEAEETALFKHLPWLKVLVPEVLPKF